MGSLYFKIEHFSLLLFLSLVSFQCQAQVNNISANELKDLMAKDSILLIDVRTEQEYVEGFIEGAINIDYYGDNFVKKVGELNKSSKVILYCAAGVRSAKAAKKITSLGFDEVINLDGGYKSWEKQVIKAANEGY